MKAELRVIYVLSGIYRTIVNEQCRRLDRKCTSFTYYEKELTCTSFIDNSDKKLPISLVRVLHNCFSMKANKFPPFGKFFPDVPHDLG